MLLKRKGSCTWHTVPVDFIKKIPVKNGVFLTVWLVPFHRERPVVIPRNEVALRMFFVGKAVGFYKINNQNEYNSLREWSQSFSDWVKAYTWRIQINTHTYDVLLNWNASGSGTAVPTWLNRHTDCVYSSVTQTGLSGTFGFHRTVLRVPRQIVE
jgi:hypothetical protein